MQNRTHWFIHRTYDPIGKIVSDLGYLQFRRNLLLAMTRNAPEVQICVHRGCRDQFNAVEFFDLRGDQHPVLEVEDRNDALAHGAEGLICACVQPTGCGEPLELRRFHQAKE